VGVEELANVRRKSPFLKKLHNTSSLNIEMNNTLVVSYRLSISLHLRALSSSKRRILARKLLLSSFVYCNSYRKMKLYK